MGIIAKYTRDFVLGRYELEHRPASAYLMQILAHGSAHVDEVRALVEHAPRLARYLCDGLEPMFGKVTTGRLIRLAKDGYLSASIIERAIR